MGFDLLEDLKTATAPILEPDAPAHELAALYPKRWEIETALDELKIHQRGPRAALRSKTRGCGKNPGATFAPTTRSAR